MTPQQDARIRAKAREAHVLVERARVLAAVHEYLRHAERETWSGVDDAGLRRAIRRWLALRWAYRQGRVTS